MADVEKVRVDLNDRSYDIHIGSDLITNAGQLIHEAVGDVKAIVISDENVFPLYGEALKKSLDGAGIDSISVVVPAGEPSKSFDQLMHCVDAVLAAKLERGDIVIALGGGVIGDLAGFVAGIVRRGMGLVQIPTSLLAQVDSSVGGKTGINSPHGKNLIGVFHQPKLVIADTDVLKTLSKREFTAGYAEVTKYGLIDKPDFFHWLCDNWQDVFGFGDGLTTAIAQSCRAKADVVKKDEFEGSVRALLNLGHTFGHALEAAVKYDSSRLVHGEGVAIGMVQAHQFSNRMNLCDSDSVNKVIEHLNEVGLPTRVDQIPGDMLPAEKLLKTMFQDKKVSKGALTFILTRGLGESFIAKDVVAGEVLSFLKENIKG